MAKDYEINEKDIDAVIRFLKLTDPEHATPEIAIELLEHMQMAFHTMAHDDPEILEKIYQDMKLKRKDV